MQGGLFARLEPRERLLEHEAHACWRRPNIAPPRRSKFDPGAGRCFFELQLWISVPSKEGEFVEGEARNEFPFILTSLLNDINDYFFMPSPLRFCSRVLVLPFCRHAAMLEAVGLVSSLHDMAVMCQAVQ